MAALNKCIFRKKSGCQSSVSPEILAFGSHCSVNFRSILDCFKPDFKLKYDNSENTKTDLVNTVTFNLKNERFYGTSGTW